MKTLIVTPTAADFAVLGSAFGRNGGDVTIARLGDAPPDFSSFGLTVLPLNAYEPSSLKEMLRNNRALVIGLLSRRAHAARPPPLQPPFAGYLFVEELTPETLIPWQVAAAKHEEVGRLRSEGNEVVIDAVVRSAHELRSPVLAMMGHLERILDPELDFEGQTELVSTMKRGGQHLLHLIDDLLVFAKLRRQEVESVPTTFDLFELLDEVRAIFLDRAEEKELVFSVEFCFPLPGEVTTDRLRFKQILINLLGNAVKYTEAGSVSAIVSFEREPSRLRVDVVDTGPGIPEGEQSHIFEAFGRGSNANELGTGVGLSISRALARQLGGDIVVKSTLGQGSIFSCTVEAGPESAASLVTSLPVVSAEHMVKKVPAMRGRVLIADDISSIRSLVRHHLSAAGIEVVGVGNGRDAVKLVLSEQFDLVLMDIEMPRLSGYEAMEEIRKAGKQVPIVALTSHIQRSSLRRCLDSGADAFLRKSCDEAELYAMVGRFLKPLSSQTAALEPSPRMAAIQRKFVRRLFENIPRIKDALFNRQWDLLWRLNHPLVAGKMFGYGIVSASARQLTLSLDRLRRAEADLANQVEYLEMVAQGLAREQEKESDTKAESSKQP